MRRKSGICLSVANLMFQRQYNDVMTDGISNIVSIAAKSQKPITFDRRELSLIMGLYGRYVAEGEWRDYAIDFGKHAATFAIHRHTSEQPLYRVVKNPDLAQKQGQYSVIALGGLILKRGNDLEQVLKVLIKKPKLSEV
jgi:Protein of unknown function (DUF2794)